MKKLHLYTGLLMLLLFLASGAYLRVTLPPFSGEIDVERMMFRAGHLYLFLVAAINLMLGCYWLEAKDPLGRKLQWLGSALVVMAQPAFLLAFILEPGQSVLRLFTISAAFLVFFGVVLSLVTRLLERRVSAT